MRRDFVALLSGDNTSLALGELEAILRLLDKDGKILPLSNRLVLVRTMEGTATLIARRAAYTKSIIIPFLDIYKPATDCLPEIGSELLNSIRNPYLVRAEKLGASRIGRNQVERWIGWSIKKLRSDLTVNVREPETLIKAFIEDERVIAGILVGTRDTKSLESRRPGMRPFKHPAAIHPKLARCMVNLSRVRLGGRILDPFAGTGSIPIEAALLGYEAIAVELKRWMTEGCYRNIKRYVDDGAHVVTGDARRLMIREGSIEGVVTDPPYGRSTHVAGGGVRGLIESMFVDLDGIMNEGARIVLALPTEHLEDVREISESHGFKMSENYSHRVHASLTRIISVLERS